eukprot:m.121127 g.121127  ORF g.121127 m.121127 type:complete len:203 (-) comp17268_c0_seq1:218-826(-)
MKLCSSSQMTSGPVAMDRTMLLTSLPAASLIFFAFTSGWSMLLSSQPPTMIFLELFTGKDDYTSYDRHAAYSSGFPVYLAVCGMPKDLASEFADPVRYLMGCLNMAMVFGVVFAQRPDQRTIVYCTAVVIHIFLLRSMVYAEALVDSVILPMESMLIQIMAGVLILFGLRHKVILEDRWAEPDAGHTQDSSVKSQKSEKKTR